VEVLLKIVRSVLVVVGRVDPRGIRQPGPAESYSKVVEPTTGVEPVTYSLTKPPLIRSPVASNGVAANT
jgi:hypothetical protein